MKVLFVHQNFPGQFVHLASALARQPGHEIVAVGSRSARSLPNVRLIPYDFGLNGLTTVHPFARRFDMEARRAEQVLYIASDLAASGFQPDVVFSHCGWGESLPLRSLFPRARIVTYFEWFYQPKGQDTDFDPEWPSLSLDGDVGLRMRNATTLLALAEADVAISPTEWQRSTFPARMRDLITVCHDGIDLDGLRPDGSATVDLPNGSRVAAGEEVVTFVARGLEPLRGFHVFLRALGRILAARPKAQVLIIGGDQVAYGMNPPQGWTWKEFFLDRHKGEIDLGRVHFLGRVDYALFRKVLQVSAAHVYLTYPFVLSWSLLEAMAAECLVIGSNTAPVREVIDGANGLLVDFFDRQSLVEQVVAALARPERFRAHRKRARETVEASYGKDRCVAQILELSGLAT